MSSEQSPNATPPAGTGWQPKRIIETLGLRPLPDEGGFFRRGYLDEHSSAIYYLLTGDDFSAMHKLAGVEVYHHYAGDPLQLLLLRADASIEEPVLGPDIGAGQRPQIVVEAGTWQGSSCLGSGALIGTTMAPPFDWDGFELGDRTRLIARYPSAAGRITELTR